MKSEMILISGNCHGISHSLITRIGSEIGWTEPTGGLRTPEEEKKEYPYSGGFAAAGREYSALRELTVKEGAGEDLYLDQYGREILCVAELFPCFDSYDYLNETRHYRWFFIREEGKLSRVFYADGTKAIEVTEDVRYVENDCLNRMVEPGWIKKA